DFMEQSTISSGNIINWSWSIDDSLHTMIQNPSYHFNDIQDHEVTLVTTSNFGCKDSTTRIVAVNPLPNPLFITTDACYPGSSFMSDASNIARGNIVAWQWQMGDNTPAQHYS